MVAKIDLAVAILWRARDWMLRAMTAPGHKRSFRIPIAQGCEPREMISQLWQSGVIIDAIGRAQAQLSFGTAATW
jgi:hypothetical protein